MATIKFNFYHALYFLILCWPTSLCAQISQIDSVIVETCLYNDAGDTVTVTRIDSINYRYNTNGDLVLFRSKQYNIVYGVINHVTFKQDSMVFDSVSNSLITYSIYPGLSALVVSYDSLQRKAVLTYTDYTLVPQQRIINSFLPNDEVDNYFKVFFSNGLPTDTEYFQCAYDSAWNKIEEVRYMWGNGSIGSPNTMIRYYYDSYPNLIAYNNYIWIPPYGYDPCWLDTAHFTYNAANLISEEYYKYCGGGGSTHWYTYDQNGSMDSSGYSSYASMGRTNSCACKVEGYLLVTTVDEIIESGQIMIYPNPANQELIIRSSKFKDEMFKIKVLNFVGELVLEMQKVVEDMSLVHLDISSMSSGLYFLLIYDSTGGIKVKKFVKGQ